MILENHHIDTSVIESKYDLKELYSKIEFTEFFKTMKSEISCFQRFTGLPNIFKIRQQQYLKSSRKGTNTIELQNLES